MLLKITEKCSMGCTHCMNDSKPTGKHMDEKTFHDAVEFLIKHKVFNGILISGGEPTEHPQFVEFIEYLVNQLQNDPRCSNAVHRRKNDFRCLDVVKSIVITTNGVWMLTHRDEVERIINLNSPTLYISFQVSTDPRYYPERIDVDDEFFTNPRYKPYIVLCDNCVEALYPQGRAADMKDPNGYLFKGPKCFNVIAILKQLQFRNRHTDFSDVINSLAQLGKFCTPAIRYDGSIGLGESDLCPRATSIYATDSELLDSIVSFHCNGCSDIIARLPEPYRQLLEYKSEMR